MDGRKPAPLMCPGPGPKLLSPAAAASLNPSLRQAGASPESQFCLQPDHISWVLPLGAHTTFTGQSDLSHRSPHRWQPFM